MRIGGVGRGTTVGAPARGRLERVIASARACRQWTELDPAQLVERDHGILVDATTDATFKPYMGDAFSRSGTIVANMSPLFFTVDDDGLHMLERQPQSWSELVYQRERGRAAAR